MGSMMVNIRNELCISCCWTLDDWSHGVSGHIFEIIDYYHILKDRFDTRILLCDPLMTPEWFKSIISEKYDFDESEIDSLINSTVFANRPKYVKCNKILFVDGCLIKMEKHGIKIFAERIYTFMCSKYETIHDLKSFKDVIPLLDYRVYKNTNVNDVKIGVDYTKKLLFERYKTINCAVESTALIYATTNCRKLDYDQLINIINHYNFEKYIIISDTISKFNNIDSVSILTPPVSDLFNKFTTYIYTPTQMKWDGSPRFPVECKYYNKDVIYHDIDNQYLAHDRGLYYRALDIQTDFEKLHLKHTDNILNII